MRRCQAWDYGGGLRGSALKIGGMGPKPTHFTFWRRGGYLHAERYDSILAWQIGWVRRWRFLTRWVGVFELGLGDFVAGVVAGLDAGLFQEVVTSSAWPWQTPSGLKVTIGGETS
jgi:hypothetical protein